MKKIGSGDDGTSPYKSYKVVRKSNFALCDLLLSSSRAGELSAARCDTVDLVGCEDVVASTCVLGLQASILSLSELASRASGRSSGDLVCAVSSVLAALGVDVVGTCGESVENIADTVREGSNNATGDT